MTQADETAAAQTVLIIEDEILIRFQVAAYLRHCGYRVIEAVHGEEALVVLQEPGLAVDIVMSDVEMPGKIDGFGLAQWLRANKPGLPIILCGSAAKAADAAADLCEEGPAMTKPYEPEALLDRIKRLLGGGSRTA
jgi:DNA-binding response OmpR family regulator